MKSDGKNILYFGRGTNADVISTVVDWFGRWKTSTQTLVEDLNGNVYDRCYDVFQFVVDNVRYKEDPVGYQYVKSPARLLKDGEGDCKSMAIFIASCLYNMNIPCCFRFVNFDGGSQYTHVYIVATDENGNEIIVDPVERVTDRIPEGEPIFNYARPFRCNKDITCE